MLEWRKIIPLFAVLVLSSGGFAWTTGELIMADKTGADWPPATLDRPHMQYEYETENFLIHYNKQGDSAVYLPDEDINPTDDIPDYVNRVGEYFEASHQVYISELGYDRPPPDATNDDDKYDVYITTVEGLTTPEIRSYYYYGRDAYVSFIQVGNNLVTDIHPDDPYPYLKAVCAHEYFHAVQMAYRAHPDCEKPWLYELTAMWAEERVFDSLNELYYNLDDYYSDIDKSLYLQGGLHMYGAWVLAEYLSQNYGDEIIRTTFEHLVHDDSPMNSLIRALSDYGLDFNRQFTLLTGWNYFTGSNYYPGFFEESEDFPSTVPILTSHNNYPFEWQYQEDVIENLGVAYIYFQNPGIERGDLIISFEADDRYREGVCLARVYNDCRTTALLDYKLTDGESANIYLADFGECSGVIMAVNWSYQDSTIYGNASFAYKAYIDSSTVDIAAVADPVMPEGITLMGNYPNPFNLSTNITFYWNYNPSEYKITVYDITGRQVELLEGNALTGENRVNWMANDNLASGVYFYHLTAGDYSDGGRMLLVK